MAKSNLQYLQEQLNDHDLDSEWLDALISEHEEAINEVKDELSEAESKISDLENQIEELENGPMYDDEIDCVIDKIQFKIPDNIKLQGVMESFKTRLEREAKF